MSRSQPLTPSSTATLSVVLLVSVPITTGIHMVYCFRNNKQTQQLVIQVALPHCTSGAAECRQSLSIAYGSLPRQWGGRLSRLLGAYAASGTRGVVTVRCTKGYRVMETAWRMAPKMGQSSCKT